MRAAARCALAIAIVTFSTALFHNAAAKWVWPENELIGRDFAQSGREASLDLGIVGHFLRQEICKTDLAVMTARKEIIETADDLKYDAIGSRPSILILNRRDLECPDAFSSYNLGGLFIGERKEAGESRILGNLTGDLTLVFFFRDGVDGGFSCYNMCGDRALNVLSRGFPNVFEGKKISNISVFTLVKFQTNHLDYRLKPGALFVFHFVQLPLHNRLLAAQYAPLSYADASHYDSEDGNPDGRPSRPIGGVICGALSLILGVFCLAIGVYKYGERSPKRRFFFVIIIGAAAELHGVLSVLNFFQP